VLALYAGIVLPMLIGFTDIVLRTILKTQMASTVILVVSFAVQFLGYLLGFFYLWRWLLSSYRFESTKTLLEGATAALSLITLFFYAFLFQADKMFSNLVWLLFYAAVIFSFYLIGRRLLRSETP
jgi:hypothetical protein